METLSNIIRIVTSDGKHPEVTHERITKRYAEIYLSIDTIISSCGAVGADQAMSEVRATLEALVPGTNASSITKPLRPTVLPQPYANTRRTLSSQITQISSLAISSPAFGFKPLPGFEPPQQLAQIISKQNNKPAFTPLAMDPPPVKDKSDDPWADLFGPISDAAIKSSEAEAAAKAAEPPPPPPPPPAPTRPLLELHETWRAEGKGGKILRCGLDGCVKWVEDARKHPPCTVKFSMSPSSLDPVTRDVLARSSRSTLATSLDLTSSSSSSAPGSVLVDLSSSRAEPPIKLLTYHVPPSASMKAPLLVHIGFSLQDFVALDGIPTVVVIVGVRVAVAQDPRLKFQGMSIRVQVPQVFGLPARVSPGGAAFDGKNSSLRWDVPGDVLHNGCVEVSAASFFVRGQEVKDLKVAAKGLVAEVELMGVKDGGETISGISLVQEPPSTARSLSWNAVMTTRP